MNEYLRTKIKLLSFFLVVLVVIVHAYNSSVTADPKGLYSIYGINGFIQEFICQGLNRIASPLFFIISGYLFFVNLKATKGDFTKKIKKRFFTLIIPYLFWSLWGLLFYLFLQNVLPSSVIFSKGLISHYTLGELLYTIFLDPVPYQLWYVRDLSVFVVISPLLYYLLKYLDIFFILLLIFTWFYDMDYIIFRNQSLVFFILGAYLSRRNVDSVNRKSYHTTSVFTFFWIAITAFKTYLVYIDYQNLFIITILHKLSIAAGVVSVNYLCNMLLKDPGKINKSNWFGIVSFSFFLFASHEPVSTILKKGLILITGINDAGLFLSFIITPVLTIAICITVGYELKRHAPKFYGIIIGWR